MGRTAEPTGIRRDVIDRAWIRSRMCGLDPGAELALPYEPGIDTDSRFTRAARPVLDYLGGLLPGCETAAVLLDAQGRLIVRVCDDPSLARRMDVGSGVPGFVWSEEYAGANAVGIALEERVPTWTTGQDHYLEALRDLACAAVPIINPLSQRIEGVLDLTAKLTKANPLMLPMALQAARTIEQRLVDAGTATEQLLLNRFLSASRRPEKVVLVISDRTELSTNAASRRLSAADRTLINHTAAHSPDAVRSLTLSDGASVKARFESVTVEGRSVGTVVTIESGESRISKRRGTTTGTPVTSVASEYIGRSLASKATRTEAHRMAGATFPLLVTGEPGVGKVHLAKIMGQHQSRVVLLDARSYSAPGDSALLREVSALTRQDTSICVIIRNVNNLSSTALLDISALARSASVTHSRVIATWTSTAAQGSDIDVPIGVRVHIPALRERPDDILDLVPAFIARRGTMARVSPPALQALLRYDWPGNVSELDMVLSAMQHSQPGADLRLSDLPAHYQRGTRRLRRIEHVERTAIVQALSEAEGNKTRAAEILEIGRATLYRKIRVYGLESDDVAI
jgi:sigma-54 dependent transcriptional regulator, acetoin dehydrogenase operon transcriptional activator AcoR